MKYQQKAAAWTAAVTLSLCAALIVACAVFGGNDIEGVKDAFRGVMAARAEAELLRGSEEGIDVSHKLICEAQAGFARADYALRQNPTDADARFLNSDLYQENLKPIGMDSVGWCLNRDYLALRDLPEDWRQR